MNSGRNNLIQLECPYVDLMTCLFQFSQNIDRRCQSRPDGIGSGHSAMLHLLWNIGNDGFRPSLED